MTTIDQTKNCVPLSYRFAALCHCLNNGGWNDDRDTEAGELIKNIREKLATATPNIIEKGPENPAEAYLPVLTAIARNTSRGRALFNEAVITEGTIGRYTTGVACPSVFIARRLVSELKAIVEDELHDFAVCATYRVPYKGFSPAHLIF